MKALPAGLWQNKTLQLVTANMYALLPRIRVTVVEGRVPTTNATHVGELSIRIDMISSSKSIKLLSPWNEADGLHLMRSRNLRLAHKKAVANQPCWHFLGE